jgi:purine-binding chemotaxis protein CheW
MPIGLDWQEAYRRLEKARQTLDAGEMRPSEDVQRILMNRARAFARPEITPPVSTEPLDLMVFRLVGGESYGIEAMYVLEVLPFRQLTPVPSAPPVLLGITNHRGRILPVLDLCLLFGLSAQAVADAGRIVAAEVGEMRFGFQVEAVIGTMRVDAQALVPPSHRVEEGGRQILTRGVTADMITVLDAQALADDPRIVIKQGGG